MIIVEKSELSARLKNLKPGTSSQTVIKEMEGVQIHRGTGDIFMTTNNHEVWGVETLPTIQDDGKEFDVVVKFDTLADSIQLVANDAEIKLNQTATGMSVTAPGLRTTLKRLGENIPFLPQVANIQPTHFEIDAAKFYELITRVEYAASREIGRPALTGVHIMAETGWAELLAEAADGFRLARAYASRIEPKDDINVIIPARNLAAIARAFESGMVRIGHQDGWLVLSNETTIMGALAVQESFPKIDEVIPTTPWVVQVESAPLLMAIKRAGIVKREDESATALAIFTIQDNGLLVDSHSDFGHQREVIPFVDHFELDDKIHGHRWGASWFFMRQVLEKTIKGETVEIGIPVQTNKHEPNPNGPFTIKDPKNPNKARDVALIMPMAFGPYEAS